MPEKLIQWEWISYGCQLPLLTPLSFELKEGDNTIEINVTEEAFYLVIYISLVISIFQAMLKLKLRMEGLIIIEAEKMDSSNDSSIRPVAEYDTALTPYTTSAKVLNVIDSASFHEARQDWLINLM